MDNLLPKINAGVKAFHDLSKREPCKTIKYCPKCEDFRPTNWFRKNKRRKDGLSTFCARCDREYMEVFRATRT